MYNVCRGQNSVATFISVFLLFHLLVSNSTFHVTEARLLINDHSRTFHINVVEDDKSLEAVKKSGPSPGIGHKFKNFKTLEEKNSGPSPGEGHKYIASHRP